MTFVVPCRRPENDSEDWFIGRDGKQYSDLPLVTADNFEETYDHLNGFSEPPTDEELAEANAEEVRLALIRRRKARDKCHIDCILREHCLDAGLEEPFGTWGGYYEEERREIVRLRDQKRRERAEREGARE